MRFAPIGGNRVGMERTVLHIVGGESRARAEQARIAFALGHHAEIYSDVEELLDRPPLGGVVLAAETGEPDGTRELIDTLGEGGIWLPVVMTAAEIKLERVVEAIRAGALDYLALPLEMGAFARRLRTILAEARPYEERRRAEVEALRRVIRLSRR
jgi:two-component system, LuxR family, response regulator FixJ